MGSEQKDIALIDRYLRGELDEAQEARYRDRLEKDILFRELHQEQQWLFRAFRRKGREEIREKLKVIDREERKWDYWLPFSDAVFSRPNSYRIGLVAGTLLILFAVGFYLYSAFETERRYMTYFERNFSPPEYIELPTARGDFGGLSQAVEAYNSGFFDEADSYFSDIGSDNPHHEILLYGAITKIRLGQYDTAADLLRSNLSAFPADQRPLARWYLALCLVRAGEITGAVGQLKLLSKTDNPYNREASQLLQKLQREKGTGQS